MPVTPITDMQFHKREKELVIGTEGRAFWVLDDVPQLYQLNGFTGTEDARLFQPKDTYRFGGGGRGGGGGGRGGGAAIGENPAGGAVVNFFLKSRPQGEVTMDFLDSTGKLVNHYTNKEPVRPAGGEGEEDNPFRGAPPARLTAPGGMNRFVWNLRYPDATTFPGLIMWAGGTTGPRASPGKYTVRLTVDGKTQSESFEVKKDPRLETTPEDYARQLSLSLQVRDKLSDTNDTVIR